MASEKKYIELEVAKGTILNYIGEQTVSKYPSSELCRASRMGAEGAMYELEYAPTADVAEVVRCSECKHLEIINKAPIYAKCKKHGIVFELWQEDTRENFCSFGARMDGDEDEL